MRSHPPDDEIRLPYPDRVTAGRLLSHYLRGFAGRPGLIVLALPRGGVPIGLEVATALGADLDVLVVRKLGLPGQPELAIGAIAPGGVHVLNRALIQRVGLSPGTITEVMEKESRELRRREQVYRSGGDPPNLAGRTVIVVDDGLATGATMRAGVTAVRRQEPSEVVVAVPVGSPEAVDLLGETADAVVCPVVPGVFPGVGAFYDTFPQLTDAEVRTLLAQPSSYRG